MNNHNDEVLVNENEEGSRGEIEAVVDVEKAVKDILIEAGRIAEQRFQSKTYNTFHLLLAIIRRSPVLREWLEGKGVSVNELLAHAEEAKTDEPFIGRLMAMVRQIAKTAGIPRHPVHLLYAILSFGEEGHAKRLLRQFCDPNVLTREMVSKHWLRDPPEAIHPDREKKKGEKSLLDELGIDYTKKAREGKLKPVIGRDDVTMKLVEILARKDVLADDDEAINNPVLIGLPGVGKTAIAKGLAILISRQDERVKLFWNYRLIYLSLAELQAGTAVRGSLEARVKTLLEECQKTPTILFFDELHMAMNLGKTEGSSGLNDILKPILAEGLNCIGATTTDEWRRNVEKDGAFARRWITVPLEEPSEAETLAIVTGAVDTLARRHLVYFPPEVLGTAVTLGRKYISEKASPGMELEDILNGVGAKVKISSGRVFACLDDVSKVIEQVTSIPILLPADEKTRLSNALSILTSRIIGQDSAMGIVADAIRRYKSGLTDPEKPLVFLFLGPSGTGKSYTGEVVAQEFMHGRIFTIDLSEFNAEHTVSRFIGSPPGYVGYGDPGLLTEPIRRLGTAVGVLDEVEKAHEQVRLFLLGLLDKGRITDGQGRLVNAKNCIFMLTSNLGSELFYGAGNRAPLGFAAANQQQASESSYDEISQQVVDRAHSFFHPEFMNRIDEIIVFRPLAKESVASIALLMLGKEKERYSHMQHPFNLEWDEAVVAFLSEHGHSVEFGARPMKREIMRRVQDLLASPILDGRITEGSTVHLFVQGNGIAWRV